MQEKGEKISVCLVNPPVLGVLEPWYDTPDFGRTGLAYLAGYLRQFNSFEVQIIDAKFEQLNFEETLQKIENLQPRIVGITAFTNEIKPAAYIASKVKQTLPGCLTVVGGVHVSAIPKETMMEFPWFDFGVIGEGEQTFYELCELIRTGNSTASSIRGIIYRDGEELRLTPPRLRIADQDSIPFPAWDLLPRANTYYIQSERGCPLNCIFCMNPNGKVARKRSVQNVINELNWVIQTFKPERISFGDELFSVDMQRAHLLLDAMIENKIGERVKWDVQTHVQFVDDHLFQKFKQAKVDRVELGIESGDEEALRQMGKGTNLLKISKAIEAGKKAGVNIGTFFLLGQPNETISSINKTIDLAVKVNPTLPMFGLMTPYPGTEVAALAAQKKGGYELLTMDWDQYNKQIGGALNFANLSRTQIEWLQVKAYLKVFLFNHRYRDFFIFLWQYKTAAYQLLRKMISKENSLNKYFRNKPADYDELFQSTVKLNSELFQSSRIDWATYQLNDARIIKLKNKEELHETAAAKPAL